MDASATPAPDPAAPAPAGPPYPGTRPAPGAPGSGQPPPRTPARASRLRGLLAPAGVMAVVVGAFGYVAAVDPNESGHYPACPLLRFTGVFCPGCGGLRSAHAFAHGDLATAFGANAAAVLGYAVFAAVWLLWVVRAAQGRQLRIGLTNTHWWAVGAALLVFSVVRNLPFGSALAP
ncbi:DUF2752 domain-containing protein [Streptomyces nitrosporeus]|nr:DUF2752 domain-containing protein [Streptomyces nitrosporeus]